MTEYKAQIVLADKVWNQINWLTRNWNKEIGALGVVKLRKEEDGSKSFYVEKLLFPKQKVTGATVHFDAGMWGELVKEHGLEGLKNIAFYWHRHPGSASHSGTDEEDTFETFMSSEAKRPYFIFYQTAITSQGKFDEEARIELRTPIRASILNNDIEVSREETPEDIAFRKEMNKIVETCIVKEEPATKFKYEKPVAQNQSLTGYGYNSNGYGINYAETPEINRNFSTPITTKSPVMMAISTLLGTITKEQLGKVENGNQYVDNDKVGENFTKINEKVSMNFKNGNCVIVCGEDFSKIMQKRLDVKSQSDISKDTRHWKLEETKSGMNCYILQPRFYYPLVSDLLNEFLDFNRGLKKENKWTNDTKIEGITDDEILEQIEEAQEELWDNNLVFYDDDEMTTLQKLINALEHSKYMLEWSDETYGIIYNEDYTTAIGDIDIDDKKVEIYGNENIIKEISELVNMKNIRTDLESLFDDDLELSGIKTDNTRRKK